MFDETDILEPNTIGIALRGFWQLLPHRKWWTPSGLAWLVVDSVWH